MTGNIIPEIDRHPGAWHWKDWLRSNYEAKRTGLRKTNSGSSTLTHTSCKETGNQCSTNQKTGGRSFIRWVLLWGICTAGCRVYPAHRLHPFWAGTYNNVVGRRGKGCSAVLSARRWGLQRFHQHGALKRENREDGGEEAIKETFPGLKSCQFTDTWIFTLQRTGNCPKAGVLTPQCVADRETKKLLLVALVWEWNCEDLSLSVFLYYSDFILTVILSFRNFKYLDLNII